MPAQYSLSRVGVDDGQLSEDDIKYLDAQVIRAAKTNLVARKLFEVERLPDVGVKNWEQTVLSGMSSATIDMEGKNVSRDKIGTSTQTVKVPVIHKEYLLGWRDIAASRRKGQPIDTLSAEEAGRKCSEDEDKLCISGQYTGWKALSIKGLATATGKLTQASAGAWGTNSITDVSGAISKLEAKQHYGPYALLVNSTYVGKLRTLHASGAFYLEKIKQLVQAVYVTDQLFTSAGAQTNALVVEPGRDNFTLGIAQDLTNWNWVNSDMDTEGKAYEVVAPRIKRGDSICEITGLS